MEFRQLKYFIAVAEELHFGRAANRIGIAQPALSQQIQQLEQDLGGKLLVRTKRSVSLTDAGKLFLNQARLMITQADYAVDITRQAFSGVFGELVIGFVESASWDILPHVIQIYRKRYPDVKIALKHLHTINQLEAIQNGNIHVGISGFPANSSNLNIHIIRKESYWVAMPKEHHLSKKQNIFINDLKTENMVTTNREVGAFYYDSMIKMCMDAGFSPQICQTANEMQTILSLVSCGIGIALIHESAKHLRSDLIYKELLGTNHHAYQPSFVWKKDNISPAVKCFLDIALNLYPQTVN